MTSTDVLICGGAVTGCAVAHYQTDSGFDGSVTVIEADPTHARAATALSASGIRQQFSTPLNIRLSAFGLSVIRDFGLDFTEAGYLYLAGTEAQAAHLRGGLQQGLEVHLRRARELAGLSQAAEVVGRLDLPGGGARGRLCRGSLRSGQAQPAHQEEGDGEAEGAGRGLEEAHDTSSCCDDEPADSQALNPSELGGAARGLPGRGVEAQLGPDGARAPRPLIGGVVEGDPKLHQPGAGLVRPLEADGHEGAALVHLDPHHALSSSRIAAVWGACRSGLSSTAQAPDAT